MLNINVSPLRQPSKPAQSASASQAAAQTASHERSDFATLLRQSQQENPPAHAVPQAADAKHPANPVASANATAGANPTPGDPPAPARTDDASADASEATQDATGAAALNQTLAARKADADTQAAFARRKGSTVGKGSGPAGAASTAATKGAKAVAAGTGTATVPLDPAQLAWQAGARADAQGSAVTSQLPGAGAAGARTGAATDSTGGLPQTADASAGGAAGATSTADAGAPPAPGAATPPPVPFGALLEAASPGARSIAAPAQGSAAVTGAAALAAASAALPNAPTSATAAATPVAIATPVNSPAFPQDLGLQLSLLARNGVQHAQLHLNPADMGPVSVHIAMDGTQARIDFGADLAATRQAIEAGIPELASALRDAGFTLSGGGVSQHSGGRSDSAGAQAQTSARTRRDASVQSLTRVHTAAQRINASGGVDVFA